MWMVVQSLNDNSIKYVPKKWYNKKKKMCAWPVAKNYSKRLIEKMTPLHLFEYYWLPVKKIGRLYGTLEEARTKMYYARILATLSVNSEQISTNVTRQTLENKIKLPTPPIEKPRSLAETHSEMYYANILSNLSVKSEHISTKATRKMSETKIKQSHPISKSSKPKQDQQIKHNNSTTLRIEDIKKELPFSSGIPKQDQQIKNDNNSSCTTMRIIDNTKDNNCDFQNQVLGLLTKMNDEILNLKSSLNIRHNTINGFDTFLKNTIGQINDSQISTTSSITLDDIFPLKSESELETFEEQIKGDKIFRNYVISSLSMLNNINNIGNSVKCMMAKMFSDEVLSQYSLSGDKQKKNFSNLSTYCLLIDTIRSSHSALDKEKIDVPLAIWLSLAKFRIEHTNRK